MGSMNDHNLNYYIDKYKIEYYFETGTGKGSSLEYATRHSFKKCYTVDIDEELLKYSYNKLKDISTCDIEFFVGKSVDILDEYVPQLPKESSTLFFLDAHFPGADFGKCTHEESINRYKDDAYPLEKEVNIILKNRDVSKDVIIIDDLLLYEDGKYDHLNLSSGQGWLQMVTGLEINSKFLYEKFEKTHDFKKQLKAQGYLIITPKL